MPRYVPTAQTGSPGPVPEEALSYFRSKGLAKSFDYRDVWEQEHAVAFTVAKAMEVDVLQDIRAAVDEAIAEGRTVREFIRDLKPQLEARGWWGRKEIVDPATGEVVDAQLGSPRRLKTIYRANLRTARAAGQWERAQRTKATHPYLLYLLGPSKEHREEHVSWRGLLLPIDHPFWDEHYPPNGWGCKCRVRQVSRAEAERLLRDGLVTTDVNEFRQMLDSETGLPTGHVRRKTVPVKTEAPPRKTVEWHNKRTGKVEKIPEGIDPGWATNPGRAQRLAPLVPPPVDFVPTGYAGGAALPPLPTPTSVGADRVLDDDLDQDEYFRAFLGEFGAGLDEEVVYTDKLGHAMPISTELFRQADGELKLNRGKRRRYVRLLADAIKEPDEIWLKYEKQRKGRGFLLKRRFVKRFEIEGSSEQVLAAFDWGEDGWTGTTGFVADNKSERKRESYLRNQRHGFLVYRRTK